jgi:hypothetical protein
MGRSITKRALNVGRRGHDAIIGWSGLAGFTSLLFGYFVGERRRMLREHFPLLSGPSFRTVVIVSWIVGVSSPNRTLPKMVQFQVSI